MNDRSANKCRPGVHALFATLDVSMNFAGVEDKLNNMPRGTHVLYPIL
jgi:hypothetical protein